MATVITIWVLSVQLIVEAVNVALSTVVQAVVTPSAPPMAQRTRRAEMPVLPAPNPVLDVVTVIVPPDAARYVLTPVETAEEMMTGLTVPTSWTQEMTVDGSCMSIM